jgi:Zn-dependent protease with chaperone function
MATDFFERQAVARRNTKWLVVMFVLAVIGILATTFAVTAVGIGTAAGEVPIQFPIAACVGTLAIIAGGTLFKVIQLRGGGSVVAERLGGSRLYPNSTDEVERRLLNVVEEMALASGVPVPPVFLLNDEQGINAFAAGYSSSDAVIGVTRGCAGQLTRDQLQGVIAHEFSHILNGDMRLNLRLIGVLHGILLMGLVGRELLRVGAFSGGGRRDSKSGGSAMYLLLMGLAFMVLGFVGVLFGNLIKAAVSRQREYLADASAVQFTRNPGGIAGALKRIGAAVAGSKLLNPRAAEASHMYFAAGISSMFSTHPPLDDRIRRIDPQWNGKYPPAIPAEAATGLESEAAAGFAAKVRGDAVDVYGKPVPVQVVRHAVEQVANPTKTHQEYARELLAAMPPEVVESAHDPYGARALIYASLLDRDADVRAVQLRALQKASDRNVFELTLRLVPPVNQLDVRARLPVVDMTLPALRALSRSQYEVFSRCFVQLVEADQRIGLFEWTLHQILLRHLRPQFESVRPQPIKYYGLQRLAEQCSVLLSTLAHASQHDDRRAFDAGARHLGEVAVRLMSPADCTLDRLSDVLTELALTAPKLRQRLVDACASCICADATVEVKEAELLRAICDMLDCPMPPLLPGQPFKTPSTPELAATQRVAGA